MTSQHPPGDDELARLLRRLHGVEPTGGTVDEALAGVRRRVARHAARVRATATAVALGAAVALVVIPSVNVATSQRTGLFAVGTPSPVAVSGSPGLTGSPPASPRVTPTTHRPGSPPPRPAGPPAVVVTAAPAYDILGCPTTWTTSTGGPWVPAAGPETTLIDPDPVRLLVCGYPRTAAGPRPLAGDVSVHQGFAAMVSRLIGAEPGRLRHCHAGAAATDYLVRADYPNGATSWVSVGACVGATNGLFGTSSDLRSELAGTLAEQGSWGAPYPGDCASTTARPGIDGAMVPGGTDDPPLLGYLCVTSPDTGQQSETELSGSSLGDLVTSLDALPASPGTSSCSGSDGPAYVLVFVYAGGENVAVDVDPDCDTGVSNGVLVAATTDDLSNRLTDLSTPSSS